VTAPGHRSRGLAAGLFKEALTDAPRQVRINAQSHLVDWYAGLGFDVAGAEFVEDGIPHTPMVMPA
jgi:ElaA protein